MKKSILLAVAVISVAAVSCKKERTCECTSTTTSVNTPSVGPVTTSSSVDSDKYTAEKQTKKYFRMDQACYSSTETDTQTGTNYVKVTTTEKSCSLK